MLTLSFLQTIDVGTIAMILIAIGIAVYLHRLDKRQPETSSPLAKPLTEDTVQTLSDDDLVRAVVSNILCRTDRHHPDVYALLPILSHGQIAVYSVWVVYKEMQEASFETVLGSKSRCFCELATDGFALIGATACEQALQTALEDPSSEETLRTSMDTEQPLALCAAYVRENLAEFL